MEKTKLLVMDFSLAFQFAYSFLIDDKKELVRNAFNQSLSKHNININNNGCIEWKNINSSEFQEAPHEEKRLKQDSSKSLQMIYARWYEDVKISGLESDSLIEAMKGSGFIIHEGKVLPVEEVERELSEKNARELSSIDFLFGENSNKPIKTGMINVNADIKVQDKREDLIDEMLGWFEKYKSSIESIFAVDKTYFVSENKRL